MTVNRQWQAFFGRGIVRTLEDFGYQGDPPTHPELLDWMAIEFMERGWSMKKLHRLIVTSATYMQSSSVSPQLQRRDPQNLLLARGPRFRLDAEIIRDSAFSRRCPLPQNGWSGRLPSATRERHHRRHLRKNRLEDEHRRGSLSPHSLHLHQTHRALRHVHHF